MAFLRRWVVTGSVMLIACEPAPTDIELSDGTLVVHAMLVGGSDSVTVAVSQPGNEAEFVTYEGPRPVANAVVRLRFGGQELVLPNGGRCIVSNGSLGGGPPVAFSGCYSAAVPGGVRNGERYELEVEVPGHPLVTGSTIVPPAFTLLTPSAGETIDVRVSAQDGFEPFTISWMGIDATHTMRLQIVTDHVTCAVYLSRPEELDFGFEVLFSAAATEMPTVFSSFLNCGVDPRTVNAKLVATSFDTAYETYLREQGESLRTGEASVGLNGAFGFFGSAAQASVPLVLTAN